MHYFIKKYWYTNQVIHTSYQRVDSVAKIIYNDGEYEEYNLAANPDSNWIDNNGMINRLYYDTSIVKELNIIRPMIIYQQGYFYFNRTLAKGIGFCFAEYGDLGGHTLDFLVYAKINDNEYGVTVDVSKDEIITTEDFILYQNYPNPFNPSTTIKFSVKKAGIVKLSVYNIQGQIVELLLNETKIPGNYIVEFNGNKLSSGFYYYKIETDNFIKVNKMLLLK